MSFDVLLQYFFAGLIYGSIYALVAIGFNIVYNATGIINFAQGEFVMLGSMIAWSCCQVMPLVPAILVAVAATALIGSAIERLFIRSLIKSSLAQLNIVFAGVAILVVAVLFQGVGDNPGAWWLATGLGVAGVLAVFNLLYRFVKPFAGLFGGVKKPNVLQMIVITIGLSIVIREIALHLWGEQVKTLPYFSGSEVSSISVLGAHFSPQLLWVLGISALAVLALTLFFRFTLTGQAMRGVSDNPDGARLCGINPNFMVNLAFVLSAAIGALAGCVTAPITQTHYAVGTELAIKGFTVAIFGGLGNSLAAVAAGLCLGLLESFSIIVFPEAYKNIVTIGILLAVLFLKPSGLFGSKSKAGLKEF